ncbi:glycosyltransferase, partial [Pseudonocardia sp.]|uniref:glycosyltransferase n=1 Tax=Pseudonocardia sp. TaxID=60912 RepID=UPI003D0E3F51
FAAAIESWLANRVDEVILVIDVSDTTCREIAARYPVTVLVTDVPGKRDALRRGWNAASTELVALVDSDTVWAADVADEVSRPFADPRVGGVGTRQNVYGSKGFLARITDMFLDHRYFDENASQSLLGQAVSCLSGRTAVYRRHLLMEIEADFMHETFWGVPCLSGDDKRLTTLILERGHLTYMQRTAEVWSTFPDTWRIFFKQRLRWARNTWRSDLRALSRRWVWRKPFLAYTMVDKGISSFTLLVGPAFMIYSIAVQNWVFCGVLAAWWWISRSAKLLPHLRRRPSSFFFVPGYVVVSWVMSMIKLHALLTIRKQRWLTRQVAVENGQVVRTAADAEPGAEAAVGVDAPVPVGAGARAAAAVGVNGLPPGVPDDGFVPAFPDEELGDDTTPAEAGEDLTLPVPAVAAARGMPGPAEPHTAIVSAVPRQRAAAGRPPVAVPRGRAPMPPRAGAPAARTPGPDAAGDPGGPVPGRGRPARPGGDPARSVPVPRAPAGPPAAMPPAAFRAPGGPHPGDAPRTPRAGVQPSTGPVTDPHPPHRGVPLPRQATEHGGPRPAARGPATGAIPSQRVGPPDAGNRSATGGVPTPRPGHRSHPADRPAGRPPADEGPRPSWPVDADVPAPRAPLGSLPGIRPASGSFPAPRPAAGRGGRPATGAVPAPRGEYRAATGEVVHDGLADVDRAVPISRPISRPIPGPVDVPRPPTGNLPRPVTGDVAFGDGAPDGNHGHHGHPAHSAAAGRATGNVPTPRRPEPHPQQAHDPSRPTAAPRPNGRHASRDIPPPRAGSSREVSA